MKRKQQFSKANQGSGEARVNLESQMAELKALREQVRQAILTERPMVMEAPPTEEVVLQ